MRSYMIVVCDDVMDEDCLAEAEASLNHLAALGWRIVTQATTGTGYSTVCVWTLEKLSKSVKNARSKKKRGH